MIKLFHLSQYFWNSKFKLLSSIIDFLIFVLFGADVKGRTLISKSATFAHHGLGVVVHPSSVIGDSCIINAKVTLGNGYPHGGAPTLGNYVYVGAGAFLGGGIFIADNVIIGANSVLTKSIPESGVIVAGVPAKIIRHLTDDELKKLTSWN